MISNILILLCGILFIFETPSATVGEKKMREGRVVWPGRQRTNRILERKFDMTNIAMDDDVPIRLSLSVKPPLSKPYGTKSVTP